jgi:hypothetical protein
MCKLTFRGWIANAAGGVLFTKTVTRKRLEGRLWPRHNSTTLAYVEPKIRKAESRLGELRSQKASLDPAAKGGSRSSTRTSSVRRRSSPNFATSRTNSAGPRTSTSTPTSMTAWS